MPEKAVYLLVVEGFADSMGGIRVLPSKALSEIDLADVAVFKLPGSDRWETAPIEAPLAERLQAGRKRRSSRVDFAYLFDFRC